MITNGPAIGAMMCTLLSRIVLTGLILHSQKSCFHNCATLPPGSDICSRLSPCQNGATCVVNPLEQYRCHCPLGFTGSSCEVQYPIGREVQFNGQGFLEFEGSRLPHSGAKEADSVVMEFKTTAPNGLLLWHGQRDGRVGFTRDYLSLSMQNGYLVLAFDVGSGATSPPVLSNMRLDDNGWHKVSIKRTENEGILSIDNDASISSGTSRGTMRRLDTTGNLFIGGLSNITFLTARQHSVGFTGCIRNLEILDSGPIDLAREAKGRNVKPCQFS